MVRWSEVDAAGIIYHAHVFDWFSETRIAWLRQHQLDYYTVLRGVNLELLVKKAEAEFAYALQLGDEIRVVARLTEISATRCTFRYHIAVPQNPDKYAIVGSTAHAFVVDGRAKRLDRYAPEILKRFREASMKDAG
ncbi:MAG: acyl-CoA thioesterase [Sulfobacillus benefaciens]|uniref:Acyl-CoA thioesterase n=1 Tax=Sulfobacillus benefaciens TaxID=453960 RepID=A0A2T2XEK6_9FIRM|nr:MAG: acyl-CoA thioesterase [Sulfobacillus benefaciens]